MVISNHQVNGITKLISLSNLTCGQLRQAYKKGQSHLELSRGKSRFRKSIEEEKSLETPVC
jgi:hypothetical protein